jgi:Rod binding domain-containing protein
MGPLPTLPVQPYPSEPSLELLGDHLRAGDPAAADKVARDFEGMFMSLILKEMRQTLGPGSLFGGGDTADVYGGLFDQFLGQHLVDAGGFGVAKMIQQHLADRTHTLQAHDPIFASP